MNWWPVKKNNDLETARPARIGKRWPAGDQNSEQSHNITNKDRGQQVVLQNHLSTTVLLVLFLGMAFLGVGVGYAISAAHAAADKAQIAEREGRLAEEAAMHLRSTMRAYGITINKGSRKDDLDQEEPIEP